MTEPATVTLVSEPTIIPIASTGLRVEGLNQLLGWVSEYRPECLPDPKTGAKVSWLDLFPHDGTESLEGEGERVLTDPELLVELAGRNCYHSYGLKAGRKGNKEYIDHSQSGPVPHRSIMYHAKFTFFLAGISRRVSHELIRHYVGADRTEEGSPSQESTRYTFHPGHFAIPPKVLSGGEGAVEKFRVRMQRSYDEYLAYIREEEEAYRSIRGSSPKGIDRKRIYESAAGLLPMQACTSLLWTTNPTAMEKLFQERTDDSADAEFRRFAMAWKLLVVKEWPNLFRK